MYCLSSRLGVFWLLTLLPALVSPSVQADDSQELQQLLDMLQEQTTIATKTRLNADYVPGMVNILQGDELEARGYRTVWEALAAVPGIDLSIEENGRKQVVVRGVGRTYASGNVKLMLNGIPMNSAQNATANPVLTLPVEQVSRIEVIRGPGSAVHGEYAYAGVINVITQRNTRRIYARTGSDNARGIGLLYNASGENTGFTLDVAASGWKNDGASITQATDAGYTEYLCGPGWDELCAPAPYSNAPGPANEAEQQRNLIIQARRKGLTVLAQWLEDGFGDHYGINHYLPPDEKRLVTHNRQQTIDVRQTLNHSSSTKSEFNINWQKTNEEKDRLFLYNAEIFDDTGAPFYIDSTYQENRIGAEYKLTTLFDKHQLLFSYDISHTQTTANNSTFGGGTFPEITLANMIDNRTKRTRNSLTVQDEYRFNDMFTLTTGLRHDRYSDIGNSTTPRIAGVWRINEHDTIKVQHSRAFRPPTFYERAYHEKYGSGASFALPSTTRSTELSYIRKTQVQKIGLTLFHNRMNDFVDFRDITGSGDWGYIYDAIKSVGAEFEWDQQLNDEFHLRSNLAYLDLDNNVLNDAFTNKWSGKIGVDYIPSSNTILNIRFNHTGDSTRSPGESRKKLRANNSLDATLSIKNIFAQGVLLRLGANNVTDEVIKYPDITGYYYDDWKRNERSWWAQLSYEF